MTVTDTTWPFGTPPLDVTEAAFLAGRDNASARILRNDTPEQVAYLAMTELAALLVEGAHHEVVLASLRGLLVGAGMLDVRDLPTQRAALAQYRAPLDKVRRLRSADVATVTRLIDEAEATLAEVRAVPPCTCRIQDAGTCCEVRILGRDCPRHADPIPGGAL